MCWARHWVAVLDDARRLVRQLADLDRDLGIKAQATEPSPLWSSGILEAAEPAPASKPCTARGISAMPQFGMGTDDEPVDDDDGLTDEDGELDDSEVALWGEDSDETDEDDETQDGDDSGDPDEPSLKPGGDDDLAGCEGPPMDSR